MWNKHDKDEGLEQKLTLISAPAGFGKTTLSLIKGRVPEAVSALKAQQDHDLDLVLMGSGELIQTLMKHNLIDRYVFLIHPLVLGSGRRLFTDGSALAALKLVSAKATPNGVVVATYKPELQ